LYQRGAILTGCHRRFGGAVAPNCPHLGSATDTVRTSYQYQCTLSRCET